MSKANVHVEFRANVAETSRKRVFFTASRTWVGFRWKRGRYFVLRDLRRHPPLFSERNGYTVFHVWVQVGPWQLGWK